MGFSNGNPRLDWASEDRGTLAMDVGWWSNEVIAIFESCTSSVLLFYTSTWHWFTKAGNLD